MRIAVIGGGGREHAIIKSLRKNNEITEIYALPGNGGIAADASCVDIKATDLDRIVEFCSRKALDFVVVAPDDPLVMGCVDRLEAAGIPCFGPDAKAAIIEGSKVFSKNLMKKYNIPTAGYETFSNASDAKEYILTSNKYPTVIKADGLALGKGVIIAQNEDQAIAAINSIMNDKVFGESGSAIVIEEFLTGPEVSVLTFTDGKTVVPMVSSMDHKRARDGDMGLNTGGMGTISPNPFYTDDIAEQCMKSIFVPTVKAMANEGRPFKGCLYFGLMLTPEGPKVIEYNCRFGDPETQVVLPLLKTDLHSVMKAVHDEKLDTISVEFEDGACCCVIIASGGYPEAYAKGQSIEILPCEHNVELYHAGTAINNGQLITSGGRVIGVSAKADTLEKAIKKAYRNVNNINFNNSYYRSDIGGKALLILQS